MIAPTSRALLSVRAPKGPEMRGARGAAGAGVGGAPHAAAAAAGRSTAVFSVARRKGSCSRSCSLGGSCSSGAVNDASLRFRGIIIGSTRSSIIRAATVTRVRASREDDDDNDNDPSCARQQDAAAVVPMAFGSGGGRGKELPTQADLIAAGVEPEGDTLVAVAEEGKKGSDVDYLQELIAIQQSGPKILGFFGTRNMGFMHQQLIEILSYAMVLTENHIITSGATGTNAAVIRGALRAEKPDLLTVVLPQSLSKQPSESQELLKEVANVITMPANDKLPLGEASRICNRDILQRVQHVICFAFHDSRLLLETCKEGKEMRKIVTLFYLD